MNGHGGQAGHVHRWGHGKPLPQLPDVYLTVAERLGFERPRSWPTPLLCLDCGELWPGVPVQPVTCAVRS